MEDKIIEFNKRGKVRRKVYAKEAIALKKIRIFKKMKRSDVAKALGVSERIIERLENGRTSLTIERTRKLLRHYRVSKAEFKDIIEEKVCIPDLCPHTVHKRIGKGNYVRRFDTKKITKEVKLLKSLRDMCGMSQSEVGRLCDVHAKSIGHIEHGRVDLTDARLSMLLLAYKISDAEFDEMLQEDLLRFEVIGECTQILKKIESNKLKAVRALLINF